ncbi:MAG TPA: hypothetical protein VGL89_07805 [Candidatus Koribacter sp.]|jgi:hypothetical protein
MGLIAVVYRDKHNLPFDLDKEGAEIDDRTGAVFFRDPERKRLFPRETRQATRIKLGTTYDIVEITKELGPFLGAAESILTDRVLYDLSHSGDTVDVKDLQSLETELLSLKEKLGARASKLAMRFIEDMLTLVKAAMEQHKPIVFV